MTYGFRGLGEPKIRQQKEPERVVTGLGKADAATDTSFEDIDPADFFDPEEFGIRREARPYGP